MASSSSRYDPYSFCDSANVIIRCFAVIECETCMDWHQNDSHLQSIGSNACSSIGDMRLKSKLKSGTPTGGRVSVANQSAPGIDGGCVGIILISSRI